MIAGAFTRGLRELEKCSGAGRPGVLGLNAEKLSFQFWCIARSVSPFPAVLSLDVSENLSA